jgi:LysR family transcriptional regulator, transcription activator of glutamate synthase operon
MRTVDIAVLRSFVAVAGGATLTEAASAAVMSQPAMTRALQRLEAEMGAPLFDRVGRGLRLNANGEVLLAAARRALVDLDGARQEIDGHRDAGVGIVRLGFLNPLGSWLIPDVLSEYRRRCPQVDFDLHQDGADNILESLVEGGLDLLITSADSAHPSVAWEPLFDEELVLVVPSGHRLADHLGPVPLGEVAGETFILFRHGYGLRRLAESVCAAAGFAPRVGFEGHDLTTLYGLIRAGCGVGVFPAHPQLPDGLREIGLDPHSRRTVGVAWCPGSYRSAAVEAFRQFALSYSRPA